MKIIYDTESKFVVAGLASNIDTSDFSSSVLSKMFPNYTGRLDSCLLDVSHGVSIIGSEIHFLSGIPYKLTKKDKTIFELSKEEIQKRIDRSNEEKKKRVLSHFPCICGKSSVESFVDRLVRIPQTSNNIVASLSNGNYFDEKILKVGWWGSFTDAGGYANMNRQIESRLHNHHIIPYIRMYPTIPQVEAPVADLLNLFADLSPKKGSHPFVYAYTPMPHEWHNGKRIFFTMFETATLHPVFVDHCNKYSDEIWVPSTANKEVFVSSGIKKIIRVIPLGIDELIYFSDTQRSKNFGGFVGLFGKPVEEGLCSFKFVTVIQWNFRKGYDALLKSFVNAFTDKDDVCMVITTQYSKETVMNDLTQFLPRQDHLPQVVLYNHVIPTIDMPAYYKQFDCYIHLSRGEGFSLTQIEAGACGLPVISCFHSGMTEYLTGENSYMIECPDLEKTCPKLNSICCYYQDQLMWKLGPKQIDQSIDHMKNVFSNYSSAKEKSKIFYKEIVDKYTWEKTTERVVSVLKTL